MWDDRKYDRTDYGTGDSGQSGQNGGYTYTYQQGGDNGWRPVRPQPGRSAAIPILTVLLCVMLSFAAGVGGATLTCERLLRSYSGSSSVPAPDAGSLYSKDPSSLIDRSDAAFSPYGSAGEDAFSISSVARMVQDAVVVIDVTTDSGAGAGSGVIISTEGYILTCNHVIEGARTITVTVNGCAETYQARTVGTDASTDLAVLKISPQENEPLTAATHGISENLAVGEHVVAIGNPLGTLGGTVTDGIISAKARRIQTDNGTMTLLQTNAAINSGNSGGGLFNLKGELIGIVNAKYAKSGVEGLAFAIPIDTAYEVEKDLIQYGYVQNIPDVGISLVEVNRSNLQLYALRYNITEVGLYVVSSKHCDELKNRDRLLTVNGVSVTTEAEYNAVIAELKVGDTLTVTYRHGTSGAEQTASFVIPQYVPDGLLTNAGIRFDS